MKKQNRLENLKHNYVAFQLPRDCTKNITYLFFLNNNFPFTHHVAAFTLSLPASDTLELFNVQFLLTVSMYSSTKSLGE